MTVVYVYHVHKDANVFVFSENKNEYSRHASYVTILFSLVFNANLFFPLRRKMVLTWKQKVIYVAIVRRGLVPFFFYVMDKHVPRIRHKRSERIGHI